MKLSVFCAALGVMVVGAVACNSTNPVTVVPATRFYYPSGLVHLDAPNSNFGVLVVANGNFDKRFGAGTLAAVSLDEVKPSLPAFSNMPPVRPLQIPDLGGPSTVRIASFAGEVGALHRGGNDYRLFVPTRSEGMRLHSIDLTVLDGGRVAMTCHPTGEPDASFLPGECDNAAVSLSPRAFEQSVSGLPRAPGPYGVGVFVHSCTTTCPGSAVCRAGTCFRSAAADSEPLAEIYVSHLSQADSPYLSGKDPHGFAVKLDAQSPRVSVDSFIDLDAGATNSVVMGSRWAFFTGRYVAPTANFVRMVSTRDDKTVLGSGIETNYRVLEARGAVLSSDGNKLFVAGRAPDSLVVSSISGADSDQPTLRVVRTIPLPAEPNYVRLLPRAGRGDLLAITCTGAGVVVLYDDDVGDVVAQVSGVGVQPFGMTVDLRDQGARLYVSDFQDGRVAVIDVPNLKRPQEAWLVAHLGVQQLCLTRGADEPGCDGGVQ